MESPKENKLSSQTSGMNDQPVSKEYYKGKFLVAMSPKSGETQEQFGKRMYEAAQSELKLAHPQTPTPLQQKESREEMHYNHINILVVFLLLLALGSMPYSYYQFLRWIVSMAAIWNCYIHYQIKNKTLCSLFVAIAIMFNPLSPFYTSASVWHIIDVVSAVIFFCGLFIKIEHGRKIKYFDWFNEKI